MFPRFRVVEFSSFRVYSFRSVAQVISKTQKGKSLPSRRPPFSGERGVTPKKHLERVSKRGQSAYGEGAKSAPEEPKKASSQIREAVEGTKIGFVGQGRCAPQTPSEVRIQTVGIKQFRKLYHNRLHVHRRQARVQKVQRRYEQHTTTL